LTTGLILVLQGRKKMIAKTKIPIISIAFAATLALSKLIVAIYSGSLAVLSSALDSLLDILSSTINFFALKTSEAPLTKLTLLVTGNSKLLRHLSRHSSFSSLAVIFYGNPLTALFMAPISRMSIQAYL